MNERVRRRAGLEVALVVEGLNLSRVKRRRRRRRRIIGMDDIDAPLVAILGSRDGDLTSSVTKCPVLPTLCKYETVASFSTIVSQYTFHNVSDKLASDIVD